MGEISKEELNAVIQFSSKNAEAMEKVANLLQNIKENSDITRQKVSSELSENIVEKIVNHNKENSDDCKACHKLLSDKLDALTELIREVKNSIVTITIIVGAVSSIIAISTVVVKALNR